MVLKKDCPEIVKIFTFLHLLAGIKYVYIYIYMCVYMYTCEYINVRIEEMYGLVIYG